HQSYPLSPNGRVSVQNVSGSLRVTGWDRNEVHIDAVKHAKHRERLAEAEIKVVNTADSINIKTQYPDNNVRGYNEAYEGASVDYVISVPRGARLDSINQVSGEIDISGVTGDVRASCVSGKLKATGLVGDVKLSTVSGELDVVFDRISESKPIALSTVNG